MNGFVLISGAILTIGEGTLWVPLKVATLKIQIRHAGILIMIAALVMP